MATCFKKQVNGAVTPLPQSHSHYNSHTFTHNRAGNTRRCSRKAYTSAAAQDTHTQKPQQHFHHSRQVASQCRMGAPVPMDGHPELMSAHTHTDTITNDTCMHAHMHPCPHAHTLIPSNTGVGGVPIEHTITHNIPLHNMYK